jgi:hypothetical protein
MPFVPEQDIQDAKLITPLFGGSPCFHDAEILRLTLQREKRAASLEGVIHVFNSSHDAAADTVVPHTLITLRFGDIELDRLTGFNFQNVIDDLKIECNPQGSTKRFSVDIPGNNGCDATFLCDTIRVVLVEPYTIEQRISDGSVYSEPEPGKAQSLVWRDLLERVNVVLLHDWNPIGFPVPRDEYDSYALTITGMLLRRCSAAELATYLAQSEANILGEIASGSENRPRVAATLLDLSRRSNGGSKGGAPSRTDGSRHR